MPESRLDLLRARTRAAHARIETVPALARLVADDLTMAEYVAVLRSMHAFHAALEPAIAGELADVPAAAALLDGGRMRALAEDLAWFGAPGLPPSPVSLPSGRAAALGALYVVEGSGLGGRVIARRVAASLRVTPGRGGNFYGGLGADAARTRWRHLCDLLEHFDLREETAADLIDGAIATFRCLERRLRRVLVDARADP
jgi:heme oxygenase